MNLENLESQNKYIGNLEIQACFEAGTCIINENILLNTKIPRAVCDWTLGLQGQFCLII